MVVAIVSCSPASAPRLRRLHRRVSAAAGLAQAQRDRRQLARLRRGRRAARLHPGRRAAPADALGGHPAGLQGRHRRDRGRALLQAQGRRLRGRHPRGDQEPHVAQDRAGRLDDHDAARPHALHLQRAHVQAQDPRGQARRGAREPALQGVDPREVPQHEPYGTVGGQSAIGVEAAARMYFSKDLKDSRCARRRCSRACRRRRRATRPSAPGARPSRGATRSCARWPSWA